MVGIICPLVGMGLTDLPESNSFQNLGFDMALLWYISSSYQYGCRCVFSYLTFDKTFSHNIGKDRAVCPNVLANVLIKLNSF